MFDIMLGIVFLYVFYKFLEKTFPYFSRYSSF